MSLLLKGVTKLSELTIDADKDWAIKGIDSLGYVIIEDGAGHYLRLPSLTTAQRDGLAPATGMTIWNSTTAQVEKYNGSDWGAMGIAGVTVRKNTRMPVIGSRPQLNLIEGASIGINIADNPADDEIDIAIHAKYPTRFMVLIPDDAAEAVPGGEAIAALANVAGTNFGYETLDYDHTNEEVAYWEWALTPDYLSENIVVDIYWESAGAGDAKFGFSTLGREKDETWDVAMGAERTVVTTSLGAGKLNKSRITTFAPGWSPGDVLLFKLARKAGDVADTINANDVRVLKVVVSYTGQFAQSFYPLPEPVEIAIPGEDSWQDIDAAAYGVPAGATGVILHIVNISGVTRDYGLRKKGSTDDRHSGMIKESHGWAMIGIDENRKFQVYFSSDTLQDIYLVGYTATGVVFFDNAYLKNVGGADDWTQEIDLSTECPGAIGIIIESVNTHAAANETMGQRKKGSTDEHHDTLGPLTHSWQIVGCDGAQVIQAYANPDIGDCDFYIVGYVTEGAVFKTNASDKTPPTEAWTIIDCSTEAPKSVMLFFHIEGVGPNDYAVRKYGSTENIFKGDAQLYHAFVACDSAQKVEARLGYLFGVGKLHLIGYATWAGA